MWQSWQRTASLEGSQRRCRCISSIRCAQFTTPSRWCTSIFTSLPFAALPFLPQHWQVLLSLFTAAFLSLLHNQSARIAERIRCGGVRVGRGFLLFTPKVCPLSRTPSGCGSSSHVILRPPKSASRMTCCRFGVLWHGSGHTRGCSDYRSTCQTWCHVRPLGGGEHCNLWIRRRNRQGTLPSVYIFHCARALFWAVGSCGHLCLLHVLNPRQHFLKL